jgi:hypothetical protein
MLFRGIKHQVDKGPVDSVTGKAKYTLNDNRLLREDVEYRPLVRVCSAPSVYNSLWSDPGYGAPAGEREAVYSFNGGRNSSGLPQASKHPSTTE